jgi:hypothetical protein
MIYLYRDGELGMEHLRSEDREMEESYGYAEDILGVMNVITTSLLF